MLVLLLLSSMLTAQAQSKNIVWGYLKDSITNEPIVLASVTNMNKKRTVMTGNTGRFKIELTDNDILSFAAIGYYFDTLQFRSNTSNDTLQLYLSPLTRSLGNVTVRSKSTNEYALDSMARRKDFMQDLVNYTIPSVSIANSGAGIALNLDRFSKKEKAKRKAFSFFEASEKEAYINYRFPASLVTKYSGLREEVLQDFMQLHRPSYEWLRNHKTEEDIKYYINDELRKFKRNG